MKEINIQEQRAVNGGIGALISGMLSAYDDKSLLSTAIYNGAIYGSILAIFAGPAGIPTTMAAAQTLLASQSAAFAYGAVYGAVEASLGYTVAYSCRQLDS